MNNPELVQTKIKKDFMGRLVKGINRFIWRFPLYLINTSFDYERIAFFSPFYSGNAKPIYEGIKKYGYFKKPYWVLLSRREVEKVRKKGVEAYYYKDWRAFPIFMSTPIWVSTHVTDNFPVPKHQNPLDFIRDVLRDILRIEFPPTSENMRIKEVQLWHGIGFKGWKKERSREYLIHATLYLLNSDFSKETWIKEFNIDPNRIKVTGYARHDILINRSFDTKDIKREIGIPLDAKVILYAPTWEQHRKKKSIYYWNDEKLREINAFCEDENVYFVVRAHHMLRTRYKQFEGSRFLYLPMSKYPDTMKLLAITDVLITDWSSIANDFIFLNRPTIFVDTPNPFENDFRLKPEDRAGYILRKTNNIISVLKEALNEPEKFVSQYEKIRQRVLKKVCNKPDGKSTERCIMEILKLKEELTKTE